MKKADISTCDLEELACYITDLDYNQVDEDDSYNIIELRLHEKFSIDMETFREILSRLLPLANSGTSPITGQRFKGFTDQAESYWIMKMEV